MTPYDAPPPPATSSPWRAFGLVVVIVVAVTGLAMLALFAFFFIAFSASGSNK